MPQLTLTIYFLTLTRLNENWSMSMGEGKNTLVLVRPLKWVKIQTKLINDRPLDILYPDTVKSKTLSTPTSMMNPKYVLKDF